MTRFLLDTDHVSAHERGHTRLREKFVSWPPESVAVSVITVEEMIRGRMAILARRLDPAEAILQPESGRTQSSWRPPVSLKMSSSFPSIRRAKSAVKRSGPPGFASAPKTSASPPRPSATIWFW